MMDRNSYDTELPRDYRDDTYVQLWTRCLSLRKIAQLWPAATLLIVSVRGTYQSLERLSSDHRHLASPRSSVVNTCPVSCTLSTSNPHLLYQFLIYQSSQSLRVNFTVTIGLQASKVSQTPYNTLSTYFHTRYMHMRRTRICLRACIPYQG